MKIEAPKRTTPRPIGRTRITRRDLTALMLIGIGQPVTTQMCQVAMGASIAVARRRLRVLHDHGLIKPVVTQMNGENLYLLTQAGKELLVEKLHADEERIRVLRGLPAELDHHLPSAILLMTTYRACQRSHTVKLREFLMERDLRARTTSAGPQTQFPDSVAVFAEGAVRFALAVESDTGTENPSIVVKKALAYSASRAAQKSIRGQSTWAVVFLCSSVRRLHRLAKAFFDAEVPYGLVYLALTAELKAESVLTPACWKTLRPSADGARVRLVNESPFAALHALAQSCATNAGLPVPATSQNHRGSPRESRDVRGHTP